MILAHVDRGVNIRSVAGGIKMNCPHCTKPIDDKLISKHLASKGGKASKRQLSSETAKKMVEEREKKRKATIEQKKV